MNSRTTTFVSVLVLMFYGTLALVSVPFHFHDDAFFPTGSGLHEFAQHQDAADSHHHLITSHDECTICSVVSHSVSVRTTVAVPLVDDPAPFLPAVIRFAVEQDHHSTHSRRGPPALFA